MVLSTLPKEWGMERKMVMSGRLRRSAAYLQREGPSRSTVAQMQESRAKSPQQQNAAMRQGSKAPACDSSPAAPKESRMTKSFAAVLDGMRSSVQLAPRQPYITPSRGPTTDFRRLTGDAIRVNSAAGKAIVKANSLVENKKR
jgi:hypothetical protein